MKTLALPLATLLAALSCACSSPVGGSSSPADFRPIASGDTLYVWSGGLDALLVDPKDEGVREALRHMGERMLELPEEMEDPEFPADALDLAAGGLLGPMSLSVGPAEGEAADAMPVRAQMNFQNATPEEARRRADRLTQVLSHYEMPSLGLDESLGLSKLDFGAFGVLHGVAREGRADTVVVAANGLDVRERDLGSLDLPAGVVPAAAFRLDYGSFSDLLEMFGGPEVAEAFSAAGMGDLVIQGGLGHGKDRSYAGLRTIGWVPMARASGSLPEGSIERGALALIPSDATVAVVARTDFGSILKSLSGATALGEEMSGMAEGVDPLVILRETTGLDLEKDVIANLGQTFGVYMSDSTGGGGFYSAVGFVRVKDEAALRAAMARLEGRLEDLAADEGLPGFAMRHVEHAGADITAITVSGWPIPVEPCWAIQDGWLLASASIQGLRAALDQVVRPQGDLLDNEGFRAEASGSLDDLVSLSYVDVPRFLRDGYPVAAMVGAMLSNGLASANEPERVPAGVVPGFAEFARGARPTVALGRLEGEDLVIRVQGDRSLLVQMAGMVGAMGPVPMLVAGLAISGSQSEEPQIFETNGEGGAMEEEPVIEVMEGEEEAVEDSVAPVTPEIPQTDPAPGDPK
ncbi:MAG: hypothetical protein NTY35_06210 [Planctomycetota bacterium]|nr:hypothetical protein [Planctomycetota bacterium]